MSARRGERVAEEIREEVAGIIAQLKDPRIGFVTVTRVAVTADLRSARVYVGVLGDAEKQRKSMEGLEQASGFVRRELGRRLSVRHTPELSFRYDSGLEATDRVAKILDDIEADKDHEP